MVKLKILASMIFCFISSFVQAQTVNFNNYFYIKKGGIVCMTSRALIEVNKKFGNKLYDLKSKNEVLPYLFESGCSDEDNDIKVHLNVLSYGRAELDFAKRNGYIPIVWLAPNLQEIYGFVMLRDVKP